MSFLLGPKKQPVSLAPPFSSGGEGSIHLLASKSGVVAKVYHKPDGSCHDKLSAMVGSVFARSGKAGTSLAWPQELIYDAANPRRAVGYTMPQIIRKETLFKTLSTLATSTGKPGRLERRLALNLAAAIELLHSEGFVVGDVNHSNVLCGQDGTTALVDLDSIQVITSTKTFRCTVGLPEYTPAELQGVNFSSVNRSVRHDQFGLSVLIFRLLMRGEHPFQAARNDKGSVEPLPSRIKQGLWPHSRFGAGPYRPRKRCPPFDALEMELRDMFSRAFDDGHRDPHLRPSADEWVLVLDALERKQPLQQPLNQTWSGWLTSARANALAGAVFVRQLFEVGTSPRAACVAAAMTLGLSGWLWRHEMKGAVGDVWTHHASGWSSSPGNFRDAERPSAPIQSTRGLGHAADDDRPPLWRRLLTE